LAIQIRDRYCHRFNAKLFPQRGKTRLTARTPLLRFMLQRPKRCRQGIGITWRNGHAVAGLVDHPAGAGTGNIADDGRLAEAHRFEQHQSKCLGALQRGQA